VRISVAVNGERREADVEPRTLLSDFIRHDCGLTGTHVGCEQGACGACTVHVDGEPVRSCLMLALQAEGHCVETVEGESEPVRRLQDAFRSEHALQCGFCTPGFLMLAAGLLAAERDASEERITEVLASNLCRCTGGLPIVRAVLAAQAGR
jgi:aerobic-type carbon monoxide dehydrogenase small subunit (CoxS/CutS family)